jgi:hypothetical protein
MDITYIKTVDNDNIYSGGVSPTDMSNTRFDGFVIYIDIRDNVIDYTELLSVITHELKHVYDHYDDINSCTLFDMTGANKLEKKYKNNQLFSDVIYLCYLATKHEMDARNSMIYGKLKWLKTFGKSQMLDEFKKMYIYKQLIRLKNFDCAELLSVKKDDLYLFTQDLLLAFYKQNITQDFDIENFYKHLQQKFVRLADEYLIKADEVIDDLINDKKTYMGHRYHTWNPYFFKVNEKHIQGIINSIFVV